MSAKNVGQNTASLGVSSKAGFTLIELLITIVVLGLVVMSLGGLYYITQQTEVKSQQYDLAVSAARNEIESLRNTGYSSLTAGQNINFTSSLPSQLPANKQGTVVVSQPASGLARVDVTITYTDYGATQTVELSSDIGIVGLGQSQ